MRGILLLLCVVTLVSSFSSDRVVNEDHRITLEDVEASARDERSIDFSEEPQNHKGGRRARGSRRRHVHDRKDELPADVREIFDLQENNQQQVQQRRSIPNDWYGQLQNYVQRSMPYQGQNFGPYPNSPQVNNYYPQYPYSPYQSYNPYPQNPLIIFLPYPICYPQPANTPTTTKPDMTTVINRFGGSEVAFDGMTNVQNPPPSPPITDDDDDDYYKPLVGVSLDIVPPRRPPSRPPPPIQHSSSGSSETNTNVNQNYAPNPAVQASNSFYPVASPSLPNGGSQNTIRPTSRPSRPSRPNNRVTTMRPSFQEENNDDEPEPSNCAKAIVECCPRSLQRDARDTCFEENSCGGIFWDADPCDNALARAAEQTIRNFRNRGKFGK